MIISIENITLTDFLAACGFAMSLSTWIYTAMSNRQKLSFRIHEAKNITGGSIFFMQIENLSRIPVAVTRIQLEICGQFFDCIAIPTFIMGTTDRVGSEVVGEKAFYSMQIPIEISSLGAVSGYIFFDNPQAVLPADSTAVNFLIHTNRGKKVSISLPLPDNFHHTV